MAKQTNKQNHQNQLLTNKLSCFHILFFQFQWGVVNEKDMMEEKNARDI